MQEEMDKLIEEIGKELDKIEVDEVDEGFIRLNNEINKKYSALFNKYKEEANKIKEKYGIQGQ